MPPLRGAIAALLAALTAASPVASSALTAQDDRSLAGLRAAVESGAATDRDRALYAQRAFELATLDAASAAGELALARRALTELVAAEPHNARFWSMLSWFCQADAEHTDLAEARRLFESGRERAPEAAAIVEGLAAIHLLRGDVDAAAAVVDDALKERAIGANGRRLLALLRNDIAVRQAGDLLAAGRAPEGERLLEARVTAAEDPEVRAAAKLRLDSYRRQLGANDLGARYRAAIELIDAQKIEQGAEALRAVIRDGPGSQWADLARVDLEKVEAFLARRRARQSPPTPPPASPPL